MNKLLEVKNLTVKFKKGTKVGTALDNISFYINKNEILGIVGESGSGKTLTGLSILNLLPTTEVKGEIIFKDKNLLALPEDKLRKIRGNLISMIFQEPMTSLNPVFTIGNQLIETIMVHKKLSRKEAKNFALEMMNLVGIAGGEKRLNNYPHQFSGGMRQRIMIALALCGNPELIIADEPTTALDVTIQAQILELLLSIRKKFGTSIMFITHNLGVIAKITDKVIVLYCGQIMEIAETEKIFKTPLHPYTIGLINSIPDKTKRGKKLQPIPGNVPSIFEKISGCKFYMRCKDRMQRCGQNVPELSEIKPQHLVRCFKYEK